MRQIRFTPLYCTILLLAGAAWGQIPPQDETTLPSQLSPVMQSPGAPVEEDDEKKRHTIHGVSRLGYNVFDPRDRALLRYYYYRHLLEQERKELEAEKEELRTQRQGREEQEIAQTQAAQPEPPTVIREYRFYQPPIQLDPYMVQRVLQRRAEQEHAAQDEIDEATPAEITPTPTPAKVRTASEILFDQGKNAFRARSYFNAMKTFEQLNQAAPNQPHVEFAYGLSLFAMNQFDRASKLLPRVIEESKLAGIVLPPIAEFYSNERDYLSHRAALKRRLNENPENAELSALYLSLPSRIPEDADVELE